MATIVVMRVAGVLWLVFGFVFFLDLENKGIFQQEYLIPGSVFMSFGMLFIGMAGIIDVLHKRGT